MDFGKILVFRIGHLGDTLVSLPAFWSIRNTYPNAKLTLLSNADRKNPDYISARAVLPAAGLFDDWITYSLSASAARDLIANAGLLARLRGEKFDAAVYLMPRSRTAGQISRDKFFFRAAGIKNLIGTEYLLSNRLSEDFSDDPVESESDYLLNCIVSEGFAKAENAAIDLLLTNEEIGAADQFLRDQTPENERLIAIAPGSKWESKVWPEARFGDVVERLIAKYDVFPVIFGGPEDREKGERFIARWQTGANAAGVLNIREAAAALQKCLIYLGNDTGTMHLAATVGTPCVAIFAAIDRVGRWDPIGVGHQLFRRHVECEGCHSPVCFNNGKCLDLISADEVYRACSELLNGMKDSKSFNINK